MLNAMKKIIKNDKLKFQLLGARDFREGFKKKEKKSDFYPFGVCPPPPRK